MYGLMIEKSLLDFHNGELDIESNPNEGTMVTIRLPGKVQ
jgi:signal transduction histidine kinase